MHDTKERVCPGVLRLLRIGRRSEPVTASASALWRGTLLAQGGGASYVRLVPRVDVIASSSLRLALLTWATDGATQSAIYCWHNDQHRRVLAVAFDPAVDAYDKDRLEELSGRWQATSVTVCFLAELSKDGSVSPPNLLSVKSGGLGGRLVAILGHLDNAGNCSDGMYFLDPESIPMKVTFISDLTDWNSESRPSSSLILGSRAIDPIDPAQLIRAHAKEASRWSAAEPNAHAMEELSKLDGGFRHSRARALDGSVLLSTFWFSDESVGLRSKVTAEGAEPLGYRP